jgi:hypothetical protein
MKDFIEAMDMCAFDVDKAAEMTKVETRTLKEIINEMLEEAGLDALEKVQSESAGAIDR